ncbi:MAG: MMPL family transporter [Phycisphaerae bacterium]
MARRSLWLIGWPVLAALVFVPAPRVADILHDDETSFLPADMPSERAQSRLEQAFPDQAPASRVAVLVHRESGLTSNDRAFVNSFTEALLAAAGEREWQVQSSLQQVWLKSILERDSAILTVVNLPSGPLTHHSVARVRDVQDVVAKAGNRPEGLQVEITGDAALGELLDANAKRDVDLTTVWAFVAVIVILLAVYRSPVAMLIPVSTISMALLVSVGLLGWSASWGLPVNGLIEMFIVVILVGSGTDYCLFLFSSFREATAAGKEPPEAAKFALQQTGAPILAGAGTNAAALATMLLVGNRDLYTSGPTIAVAILIATVTILTLTPALLSKFGGHLLWPAKEAVTHRAGRSTFWDSLARFVVAKPALCVFGSLVLLLPLAVRGFEARPLFDALDEYPLESSFVRGAKLYHALFHEGEERGELAILLRADAELPSDETIKAEMDALHARLGSVSVVAQRDLADPLGTRRRGGGDGDFFSGVFQQAASAFARDFYVSQDGRTVRVDLTLAEPPRSEDAMALLEKIEQAVRAESRMVDADSGEVLLAGETSVYRDMRDLRRKDFAVIAIAASFLIYLILIWMLRSLVQALLLVGATLLTYLAAYGATYWIFLYLYGLPGLNWQIDFLLFIIIMSLGQDYNIFVVDRIRVERKRLGPKQAIETAVARTGGVVSSCGLIMAATFFSMAAGSLVVMKEMAVALALGVLIDTFLVRPLLVPAMVLLLSRDGDGAAASGAPSAG